MNYPQASGLIQSNKTELEKKKQSDACISTLLSECELLQIPSSSLALPTHFSQFISTPSLRHSSTSSSFSLGLRDGLFHLKFNTRPGAMLPKQPSAPPFIFPVHCYWDEEGIERRKGRLTLTFHWAKCI